MSRKRRIRLFSARCLSVISKMGKGELLTKTGDRYSEKTLNTLRSVAEHIYDFETRSRRDEFDVHDFYYYLQTKGLAKSTTNTACYNALMLLRHTDTVIVNPKPPGGEETNAVWNPVDELTKIAEFDFSDNRVLDEDRDIFILHSNIGVRVSDMRRILTNIERHVIQDKGRYYFQIRTGKTKSDVVIPLNTMCLNILTKRGWKFLVRETGEYNAHIKEIGRRVGLTQPFVKYITKRGRMTEQVFKKYEKMSSHTARRNFATNAWLAGVPDTDIMKITGHHSVSAFYRYIRADSLQKAIKISSHPFFQ